MSMYILTREQIEQMIEEGKINENVLKVNQAVTGWSLGDLMNTAMENSEVHKDNVNWYPEIVNYEVFNMVSDRVRDRASDVDNSETNQELIEIAEEYIGLWIKAVK